MKYDRLGVISMSLAKKSCKPCRGAVPVLNEEEISAYMKEVTEWQLVAGKKIKKKIEFKDFMGPMDLANKVAAVAEGENHHPDLLIRWGALEIEIWTHSVDGLTESDFILAAKIDQLANSIEKESKG